MSAKKEKPTKRGAISLNSLPLHLAQMFPQESKPDCYLVTVAIPDATATHVIRQGGKGLKQVHDISGARVSAYTLVEGSCDECHIVGEKIVSPGFCRISRSLGYSSCRG